MTREREAALEELICDKLMEISRLRSALKLAHALIVNHHACHVRQEPGKFCPVCHHEDGTEPEMEIIAAAIAALRGDCPKGDK